MLLNVEKMVFPYRIVVLWLLEFPLQQMYGGHGGHEPLLDPQRSCSILFAKHSAMQWLV